MQHYKFSDRINVLDTPGANGLKLATTSKNELVQLTIQPNCDVPAHALPLDVTFYVLEGKGQLRVEERTIEAQRGDVIEVPKNIDRHWQNHASEPLTLLVIKTL